MEKYAVLGDIHGRYEHVEAVINRYKGHGVTIVTVGDVVDGTHRSNTKRTIDLLLGCGAINIYGNHEWVLAAMLYEQNESAKGVWTTVWEDYHSMVLASYGIDEPDKVRRYPDYYWLDKAKKLHSNMGEYGHLPFFQGLLPYFETDEFLVVHAGITSEPWTNQRQKLDEIANTAIEQQDWSLEPVQIFDTDFKLSKETNIGADFTKRLITGHDHTSENSLSRTTDCGRRIRLASSLQKNSPLFVWESWRNNVVAVTC